MKITGFQLKVTNRTNYNKIIRVDNGKIICNGENETYLLTELCYDYSTNYLDFFDTPMHPCTLSNGEKIFLNPA